MSCRYNKQIFKQTRELSDQEYPYSDQITTYPYHDRLKLNAIHSDSVQNIQIEITNHNFLDDCFNELNLSSEQVSEKKKVLLINSASALNRGGGVEKGSTAAEECLCRASNFYESLTSLSYPLHEKVKGVYSPNVTIFRNSEDEIIEPYQLDVLSVFARPIRSKKSREEMTLGQIDHMWNNIFETIIYQLQTTQPNVMVMIPIGCGVFGHSAETMAEKFKFYLEHTDISFPLKIVIACHTHEKNYQALEWAFRKY